MKKLSSIIAALLVICMLASCTSPVTPNEETSAGKTEEVTTAAPIETTEVIKVETTEAPDVNTTEAPVIETTEAPDVNTTEAPVIETTEAPDVNTTEVPVIETTEAPAVDTTEEVKTEETEEENQSEPTGDPNQYPYPPYIPDDEDEATGGNGGGNLPGGGRPGSGTDEDDSDVEEETCEHVYEYVKATLSNPDGSCIEGVVAEYNCTLCGDTWEYTYYNSHFVEREMIDIGDYTVCENHQLSYQSCLCGAHKSLTINYLGYQTDYDPEDADCDELITYDTCNECGISATLKMDLLDIDGCTYIYVADVSIEVYGEEVYNSELDISSLNHDYIDVSVTLAEGAESCMDGVSILRECKDCGETAEVVSYSHYAVEEPIDLSEYDTCGEHTLTVSTCICGAESNFYVKGGYSASWDEDLQKWVSTCENCEFLMYYVSETGEKDDQCWTIQTTTFELYFDTDYIGTYVESSEAQAHQVAYSYEFLTDSGKCTDGLIVSQACRDCGRPFGTTTSYDHELQDMEQVDLSAFDICDSHEIWTVGCPCGAIKNHLQKNISNSYTNWDEEKEKAYSSCPDCGLRVYVYDDAGGLDKEEDCFKINYSRYEYYVYGEEIVHIGDYYTTHEIYDHNYVWDYKFLGEEENCEGGVVCSVVCDDCGALDESVTSTTFYSHQYGFRLVDLGDSNVCEAHQAQLGVCPCGKEYLLHVAEMTRENISDDVFVDTCAECGLTITHVYGEKTPKDEECTYQQWITATFTIGETEIKKIEYKQTFPNRHRNNSTVTLRYTNSTSCEDGIYYHVECKDCDYTYDAELNFHLNGYIRYDIEGGCADHEFIVGACACKQNFEAYFTDFDVEDEENESWHGCSHCDVYVVESIETVDEETYTYTRFYIGEEKIIGFVTHNNETVVEE